MSASAEHTATKADTATEPDITEAGQPPAPELTLVWLDPRELLDHPATSAASSGT